MRVYTDLLAAWRDAVHIFWKTTLNIDDHDVYFFRLTFNMRQGLMILGPWKIATSDNQRTFKDIRMADEQ